MKGNYATRVSGSLLLLLLIGSTLVPAVSAQPAAGEAADCGCCSTAGIAQNASTVELDGAEANKAVANALKKDDVKQIRKRLLDNGFHLRRNDATVKKVTNSSRALKRVNIPFELRRSKTYKTKKKGATQSPDQVRGGAVSVVSTDQTTRVMLTGPATLYRDAWKQLKANATYNRFVDNYTAHGYEVRETKSRVAVDRDQRTAWFSVPVGTEKLITAKYDLEKGELIHVKDPPWILGYTYIGTYQVSDICGMLTGACLTITAPDPTDTIPPISGTIVGGCWLSDFACWAITWVVPELTSCDNPKLMIYHKNWWYSEGTPYIGVPTC